MGWVTLSCRNQSILHQKLQAENELMDINQKLMSLQSFASSVVNGVMNTGRPGWFNMSGVISPYDRAKLETDTFIKQNGFVDPKSGKYYFKKNNKPQMINPQEIFNENLRKAANNYIEQLRKSLHEMEKQMSYRRDQLNIKIKMLQAEYDSNKNAISESIKESAPRYV